MQLRELTVVKNDGRREPFDRDKLARSIRIALRKRPIEEERIERIVNGIVRQLESSGESDIPSKQIGELVMDTLKELDPVAYVRFASVYQNFREAEDFEDFVGSLGETTSRAMTDPMPAASAPGSPAICGRRWRWRGAGSAALAQSAGRLRHREGRPVVGRGCTAPGGRPHAETAALAMAGEAARGATAYVSLEPCCHWGKTPPCTEALIAAGIARVVVAIADPDPRVYGAGIGRLREAGIRSMSACADEAAELNGGFPPHPRWAGRW